ncbi:hypothetical protein GUJ93_ZPchr0008g11963 [Zizania palustris]|uniref:USP domain-containing protein n=2 Tax=Zizania palustris TaxID=103762 RepID=A0A8J5RXS2_ZIZPA|nr:hypothetical protein GUJ93_ZPchr0008g11963 [Zizania palustris]
MQHTRRETSAVAPFSNRSDAPAPRPHRFRAILAFSGVMEECKRARAGDIAVFPRKAPRLVLPAAAGEADSGRADASSLEVSNPWEDEKAVGLASGAGIERCEHFMWDQDDIDKTVAMVRLGEHAPICSHYLCDIIEERNIMVCLECDSYFCFDHTLMHASDTQHWVAFCYGKLHSAFCFVCQESFNISGDNDEEGMVIDDDEGGHTSGLSNGHAHNIKGILNLGNTCHLNSLVQCLLVLGKLRARMLGPDAPLGFIGKELNKLFEDAYGVSSTRGLLDPTRLLACVRRLNSMFIGASMQDSHEVFCCLRDGLDKEEKQMQPLNMQDGAPSTVAPSVIDYIFGGQLSVTTSCNCCSFKSVSHDVFYDLSVPIPPKATPTKSVASPPCTKAHRSLQNIRTKIFPSIDKSKTENIHTVAEDIDSQSPASELEDVAMVKIPDPLKADCTKVEQISHSKDAAHGPLQTQKDEVQGQIITQLPIKAVDSFPENVLSDVKFEGICSKTADSHIPEDIRPPLPLPSIRKENPLIVSGSDVETNDSAALDDAFSEPEVSSKAKLNTFSAKVTTEDRGKVRSSCIVYDEAEDTNSIALIDECLELHFKSVIIEWTCENCAKVAQKPDTILGKCSKSMTPSINQGTTVGDQIRQIEKITCQIEQSSNLGRLEVECTSSSRQPHVHDSEHQVMPMVDSITKGITPGMICAEKDLACNNISNKKPVCHEGVQEAVPSCVQAKKQANLLSGQDQNASTLNEGRGKQVKLRHSAHQVEENQNEQRGRNNSAIQTSFICQLPPVLAIHLKRSLGSLKVRGHVSFKEILDVGLFMDPSYRLVGVVEHRGNGNGAGHYVAYVRASHRQQTSDSSSWFLANDAHIEEISLEEVLKCEAYLLFYERMEG